MEMEALEHIHTLPSPLVCHLPLLGLVSRWIMALLTCPDPIGTMVS